MRHSGGANANVMLRFHAIQCTVAGNQLRPHPIFFDTVIKSQCNGGIEEKIMRIVSVMALCIPLVFLAGCVSQERVYGNIYEGLKTREMNVNPGIDPNQVEKPMPYQEYENERKKLLKNDKQ